MSCVIASVLLMLLLRFDSPVRLRRHEDLLLVEESVLVVHDVAFPLHSLGYCLDSHEYVNCVTDDSRALMP